MLCFFPSYSLIEKLMNRWRETFLLDEFYKYKTVFEEPKRSGPQLTKLLQVPKSFPHIFQPFQDFDKAVQQSKLRKTGGPLLMAVYRGKVSEGINFADENARAVLLVGIPYPSTVAIFVNMKKEYNKKNSVARKLVDGNEWYQMQAFRAYNQAVGRCLRHKYDYAAIILLEDRLMVTQVLRYEE
jgi:Fanconi anemia group J protein